MGCRLLAPAIFVALATALFVSPTDPGPLQDLCVADPTSDVSVNGFVCKHPRHVTDGDFFYSGLDRPGDTRNEDGSAVTAVDVAHIPGLSTLGISMARIDLEPLGLNPPHIHLWGTEMLTVLEGTVGVGFVTSDPDNRLVARVLKAGDVFVFPVGLVHFQINIGKDRAVALAALSSQKPGVVTVASAVFGSHPRIDPDVLAKAFQLDRGVLNYLLYRSWMGNQN